jgi:hypothetical protein
MYDHYCYTIYYDPSTSCNSFSLKYSAAISPVTQKNALSMRSLSPNRSAGLCGRYAEQLVDICSLLICQAKTIPKHFVPSDKVSHRTVDNDAIRESFENDRRAWSVYIVRDCFL